MHIVLGLASIAVSMALMGVGIQLLREKVPRGAWYGFRTDRSMQSDEAWYDINRYGATRLMRWAMVPLIGGVAILLVGEGNGGASAVMFVLLVLPAIGMPRLIARLYAARRWPLDGPAER